jgi:hypothetical protein
MRRRVYLYILVLTMFVMYGCNKKDKNELKNDQIVDYKIEDTVVTLTSLVQKTDAEVIGALGEGKGLFEKAANGHFRREYSLYIEGEEVITTVTYEDNKVSSVDTYLPDLDINKWERLLTSKLGYPTKLLTVSSNNSNMQTVRWKVDSNIVTLLGINNSLSMQIE